MPSTGAELVHIWNRCHACGAIPIIGQRFTCKTCPAGAGNDLCESCYRLFEQGRIEHPSPEAREAPLGPHVFRAFEGTEKEQALPWLAVPWSDGIAPKVLDRFVVRPEFRSGRESFVGSYGFAVAAEDGKAPVMLTALHVLDELAKFRGIDCFSNDTGYIARELPQQVTGVQLHDPFAANWVLAEFGSARNMLPLSDTRIPAAEPHSQQDIAAFRIDPSSPVQPVRLATAPPAVGEPIWLAVKPERNARERTTQAVVVEISRETFVFRFGSSGTLAIHSSGAPLLNRAGEVVGINVGGGMLDKQILGHAVHVASVRRHLGW
jgi:hypothetical protein